MIIKKQVILDGLCHQMFYACGVVDMVYRNFGKIAVITAALDSHDIDTIRIHPEGKACDFRTRTLSPSQRDALFAVLVAQLNPLGFDLVLEYVGTTNEHIHIEWDPKGTESIFTKDT
jgi:hypothetical protein